MANLPTLVFIPGAWHKAACFEKVTKILSEQYGFKCVLVTLPSTKGNPEATFKDDLDAARTAISNETTQGRDVVVLAHSYGGMVGNSAIKGFTRPQDTPTRPGYVIGLILITSGFTFTGLAFMDPFLGYPLPFFRVNKETGFAELTASPRELFYHDVPAEEAEYWCSQLESHSLKSLFEGGEHSYSGWLDVPCWYIGAADDKSLPIYVQRMQTGMARNVGASVEYRELRTSHSPFLSQPRDTARLILEAVGKFTENPVENLPPLDECHAMTPVPAVELLQPLTWYKFGLPLAFGHLLGRCVVLFNWTRGMLGSSGHSKSE
ncbi:hypothetical protein MGYG_05011 [Nannizzia gypsea CBS 118893]|uniref:AB hydrolase-1 domain-containing protein n=1 Tax=Arthroderma gypseum (strain ATCC MYA-4604 / CBS 118893) TaxID=535722 RepID=E4UY15_ARTGP|nr:hypothetical protein MGYG_05011 [Nannizzia gypsea CBS 118893]EFR02008.1 hypothetical protein MGYG_05011 [Nannizzia gypsea CBS 118893]